MVSATDVQFPHLVLERCSFQSEALGGSPVTSYSSGGSSQRVADDVPLSLFEC
jgi:hypothetical protein